MNLQPGSRRPVAVSIISACLVIMLWCQASATYGAEKRNLADSLNIFQSNTRTVLDSRTQRFTTTTILHLENQSANIILGPIRVYPNVTVTGNPQTVEIEPSTNYDEETGQPYFDLRESVGIESMAAGASVSVEMAFTYSRSARISYLPQVVQISADAQDLPPQIVSEPITAAIVQLPYAYQVAVLDDHESSQIAFSLVNAPTGMQISHQGLISWVPEPSQVGSHDVEISVRDQSGSEATQSYTLEVNTSESEIFVSFLSVPFTSATSGEIYEYLSLAQSTGVEALGYFLIVGPQDMAVDSLTGQLTWSPQIKDVGGNPIVIRAMDENGNYADQSFTIQVTRGLAPVQIVSDPVHSVEEFRPYGYQLVVEPEEGSKTFSLIRSPSNAAVTGSGKIEWTPIASYVEPAPSFNGLCSIESSALGTFDPVLKWHWNGGQVRHVPLVAQMSDDNGDGLIDQNDRADVIFIAYQAQLFNDAWIEVIDGTSGIPLATFLKPEDTFHAYGQLALGDVDNDGVVEIVATTAAGELVMYDHSGGQPKWRTQLPSTVSIMNHVALYDLNGDGNTEILLGKAVYSSEGQLLWQGEGRSVGSIGSSCGPCAFRHGPAHNHYSIAADIQDESPGLEVIVGNEVYSANGELIWTGSGQDGFAAVGDIDNDGLAEVIVDSGNTTYVYENTGGLKWTYSHISGGAPPTLSDVDGDGFLEIGLASKPYYIVLNHDGTLLWRVNVEDGSSGITGSTVFDFEGDGKADIVYFDENFLRVYDETGQVKFSIPNNSGTWTEYPVIADLEGDGHADIIIPSSDSTRVTGANNTTAGVRAFQDANNSWMGTRSIWNQHAYHIDNILDDGSIPSHPLANFKTHNTFRLSKYPDRSGVDRTDLTLANLLLTRNGEHYILSVEIHNRTTVDANDPGIVKIFNGDPAQGDVLVERELEQVRAGQIVQISVQVDPERLTSDVFAQLAYTGRMPECNTVNNHIQGALFQVAVTDETGSSDQQIYLVTVKDTNEPPQITSQPVIQTVWGLPYTYEVEAHDADLADVAFFELIGAPQGMQINSQTGVVSWSPGLDQLGSFNVQVRVSDLSGLFDIQEFDVEVLENDLLNRAPVLVTDPNIFHVQRRAFSLWLQASDPDGEVVRYSLVDPADGFRITTSGFLTPTTANLMSPGVLPILVRLTDARGLSRIYEMKLWITHVPVVEDDTPPPVTSSYNDVVFLANADNHYALSLPDVQSGYSYTIDSGPSGLMINENVLSWRPLDSDTGTHVVTVRLGNGTFSYAYPVTIHVRSSENVGPQMDISGFPGELYVNEPFEFQFNPYDPDGDAVTLVVSNMPPTASLDTSNLLKWTPSTNDVGPRNLSINVSDGNGLVATLTISFSVKLFRNSPPEYIQLNAKNFANIGGSYEYQFIASDPDNDQLRFELISGPQGMTISESGHLSLSDISENLQGEYTIHVIVYDGNGGSNVASIPLLIDFNQPPVITTQPMTAAYVGERYTYGIRASDPEGYILHYALSQAPEGMAIDPATGALSWRPEEGQAGMHFVEIVVRDDLGGEQRQQFDITAYTARIMHRNMCFMDDVQ